MSTQVRCAILEIKGNRNSWMRQRKEVAGGQLDMLYLNSRVLERLTEIREKKNSSGKQWKDTCETPALPYLSCRFCSGPNQEPPKYYEVISAWINSAETPD